MRSTVLTLVAVLATTGLATANGTYAGQPYGRTVYGQPVSGLKLLDYSSTGSVRHCRYVDANGDIIIVTTTQPCLGIDIDPWWVPDFH